MVATTWTIEMQAELEDGAARGLSARQIADRINAHHGTNITRSSVIGRSHRTGVELRCVQRAPLKVKRPPRVIATRKEPVRKPASNYVMPDSDVRGAMDAILALEPQHCRWPIGKTEDSAFRFCCADRIDGASYCHHHNELSITRRVR